MKSSENIAVIGTSAGGVNALKELLAAMQGQLVIPLIVVIHRLKNVRSKLDEVLQHTTPIAIKEAEDKEPLKSGCIYIAPANYHLLVERDHSISLSVSEPVNFSRPSIDVSLVSVAEVYGSHTIGIILSGANNDGASGLRYVYKQGGQALVQKPEEAQVAVMPEAALALVPEASVMSLPEIGKFLSNLG